MKRYFALLFSLATHAINAPKTAEEIFMEKFGENLDPEVLNPEPKYPEQAIEGIDGYSKNYAQQNYGISIWNRRQMRRPSTPLQFTKSQNGLHKGPQSQERDWTDELPPSSPTPRTAQSAPFSPLNSPFRSPKTTPYTPHTKTQSPLISSTVASPSHSASDASEALTAEIDHRSPKKRSPLIPRSRVNTHTTPRPPRRNSSPNLRY